MKYFFPVLMGLFGSAAFANQIAGTYKNDSFFDQQPAVLRLAFSGQHIQVQILAPGAACVPTFATGVLAVRNGSRDVYQLPVTKACNDPSGFGDNRLLTLEHDGRGVITGAWIRGSNGKSGWTYFSSN